jgi:hypothetical protein
MGNGDPRTESRNFEQNLLPLPFAGNSFAGDKGSASPLFPVSCNLFPVPFNDGG